MKRANWPITNRPQDAWGGLSAGSRHPRRLSGSWATGLTSTQVSTRHAWGRAPQ